MLDDLQKHSSIHRLSLSLSTILNVLESYGYDIRFPHLDIALQQQQTKRANQQQQQRHRQQTTTTATAKTTKQQQQQQQQHSKQ